MKDKWVIALEEYRNNMGYTVQEMANHFGVTRTTYYNWLKNKQKISKYFDYFEKFNKIKQDFKPELPDWFCKCGCNGTNGDMFYDYVKHNYGREPNDHDWAIYWKSRFWAAKDGQTDLLSDGCFDSFDLGGKE